MKWRILCSAQLHNMNLMHLPSMNPIMNLPPSRHATQRYGRALVILPYISIVLEKMQHLEEVLAPMRCTVKGYCGGEESGQPLAPR